MLLYARQPFTYSHNCSKLHNIIMAYYCNNKYTCTPDHNMMLACIFVYKNSFRQEDCLNCSNLIVRILLAMLEYKKSSLKPCSQYDARQC